MADSDPEAIFGYLLAELNRFNLAYLHIVDALEGDIRHGAKVIQLEVLRKAYQGNLIVCGGYDQARAETAIAHNSADAVAFGQLYIANPDLVERFKQNAPLNVPDPATFYGGNEQGYIDYPALTHSL
jgi:N-ethylmaleimide reductase